MIIGAVIQSTITSIRANGYQVERINLSQEMADDLKRELMGSVNNMAIDMTPEMKQRYPLPEGAHAVYFGVPIYVHDKMSMEFVYHRD